VYYRVYLFHIEYSLFFKFSESFIMSRFTVIFSIFFLAAFGSSQIFAQGVDRDTRNDDYNDGALEKARNEYWNTIRTSGTEKDLAKIELNAYNAMRNMENRVAFKALGTPAWQPIASSQEGHSTGRIRDFCADPHNPNTVYVTAASGGVWKTPNITAKPIQWINLSDGLPTLMGGAIAIDPQHPNTLYLGTGEADGDGYKFPPGQGLFRSLDGGNNWTQVSSIGGGYSQILVDSVNSQVVYAAYVVSPFFAPLSAGILKSTDGGTTWRKLSLSLSGPLSIAYNSQTPLTLVVGGYGGINRSVDSGATWVKSATGITGSIGQITVANAPSDPNLYYASVGSSSNNATLGVWMSIDAGVTWRKMMGYNSSLPASATNVNPLGNQQEWCNMIAVRPSNASQIVAAGLDSYTSNDSGVKWSQLSAWNPSLGTYPANYVHADHHHIGFLGNVLYDCGDGGIARATSLSPIWSTDINEGLATMQFIGVDANKNFTFVTGGCQDNGTNRAYIQSSDFTLTRGGDGGRGWVSPNDSSIVYTTYVYSTFFQSQNGGKVFNSTNLIQQNTALFYDPTNNTGTGEGAPFYPAYDVSPDGIIVAYGGNQHVWTSTSGGSDGFPLESNKTIPGATAMHIFQGEDESAFIWAGSGNNVWRSTDQGTTWLSKSVGELVMGITSNPANHNEVFVVTQGTSSGGSPQPTQKHFFKSEDGGANFTPATNFPPIGCWSVAYNPNNGFLYVGTDKGVVYSYDGGATWNPLMNGMPLAEVMSLKIKGQGNDTLLAGTYGRGMFWIDLSQLAGVSPDQAASLPLSLDPSFPNPITSSNASMNFSLNNPGIATITLFDVLGREIRVLDKNYYTPGKHQVSFTTNDLVKGTYFVMLTANGRSVSQKIIVE
jgi:hypothetical protein